MSSPQQQQPRQQSHELFNLAVKFYENDQRLDSEMRTRLSQCFGREQWAIPLGALSFLAAGIMAPRIAAQRKLIKRPVSQTRILSAMLGLPGFIIGGRVGMGMVLSYNKSAVGDSDAACNVLDILSRMPPQIGLAYYRTTAQKPEFIMKDPNVIDWKREPPFPMNLLRGTMNAQRTAQGQSQSQGDSSSANRNPDSFAKESQEQSWTDAYSSSSNYGKPQGNGEGSSWDRVRTQSAPGQQSQSQQQSPWSVYQQKYGSTSSSSTEDPAQWGLSTTGTKAPENNSSYQWGSTANKDRPGSLTPTPPPPALSGPPQTQIGRGSWEDNDQREFDQELERERQGYGLKDDFSDSEKRW